MRTHVLIALAAVACGKVNNAPDAFVPPFVSSVTVTGTSQLTWPATTQLTATAV